MIIIRISLKDTVMIMMMFMQFISTYHHPLTSPADITFAQTVWTKIRPEKIQIVRHVDGFKKLKKIKRKKADDKPSLQMDNFTFS